MANEKIRYEKFLNRFKPSVLRRQIAPRKYNYGNHYYRHFFGRNIEMVDVLWLTLNLYIYINSIYNKKHIRIDCSRCTQFHPSKLSLPKPQILNYFSNILILIYFNYFSSAFNILMPTTRWHLKKVKRQSLFLWSQLIKIPNTYISLLACTLQICSTISWNSSVTESKNAEVVWRTPGGKISLKSIGFIKSKY